MMATTRPAQREDVAAVMADLSPITAAEFRRCDIDEGALSLLAEKAVLCSDAFTFLDDEGPLCILGVTPEGVTLNTWFIATNRFFGMKAGTVFHFRGLLRHIAGLYPDRVILSRSHSRHPEARRWFRLLGYELLDDSKDFLLFRLV